MTQRVGGRDLLQLRSRHAAERAARRRENQFSHIAGVPNLGGPISTAGGVTFIAAAVDYNLRAFDTKTGELLWTGKLPAGGKATPMTYKVGGRQYVVISAGGDGQDWGRSDAVVAFALP